MTAVHDGARLRRRGPGGLGPVEVTEQVVGYLRRRPDGELIDVIGLDMPRHTLHTRAVWYTISLDSLLAGRSLSKPGCPGALHAAEHAAIGLLPLFAGCDRWDIGGLSTALHADTGEPTVIVYDGYPGGAGFADRGHEVLADLARRGPGCGRGLRLRGRLPVLRAIAQVRQRQSPAGQGRRGRRARVVLDAIAPVRAVAGLGRSTPPAIRQVRPAKTATS